MPNRKNNLYKDLVIIIASVIIAIFLVRESVLNNFLTTTQGIKFISAFLAGMFFISIFTATPAIVVLAELFKNNQTMETALIAGLGALVGDLIIFRFVKNHIAEDVKYLIEATGLKRVKKIFHLKFFHWLTPFLGAVIIASPLPDELGVSLLGLAKIKLFYFIPLSYVLNFIGILVIGLTIKNII